MDNPQQSRSLVSKSPSRAMAACYNKQKIKIESVIYELLVETNRSFS